MNSGYFSWSGGATTANSELQTHPAMGGGASPAATNGATGSVTNTNSSSTGTAAPLNLSSWANPFPPTNAFDHSALLECASCINQEHFRRYVGSLHGLPGSMNMLDSEVVQDLQYSMDDMEDDMCLGMEMKMMKKRKLTTEQARQLEASFEADKKLEAEKKQRLAEQLGLQPRQVAIWFQNRRARSKTKQLELDFLALKAEYDRVVAQRRSLQAEIANLTAQLQERNAQGKSNLGSADSKSSTNSTNGDVISKSPTTEVEKDSPKEDTEYTSNFEHEAGKSKDAAPIRQDISRSPNVHHYDWEAYEHGLWVFD